MLRTMKPETIERRSRKRVADKAAGYARTTERLRLAYEGDVIAVGQDYANDVWGISLQDRRERIQ